MPYRGEVDADVCLLVLAHGADRYSFAFTEDTVLDTVLLAARYAADPDLNFTDTDLRQLIQGISKLLCKSPEPDQSDIT